MYKVWDEVINKETFILTTYLEAPNVLVHLSY